MHTHAYIYALINKPVEFLSVSETRLNESYLQSFHIYIEHIDMIDLQMFVVKEMEEGLSYGLKVIFHQGEDQNLNIKMQKHCALR